MEAALVELKQKLTAAAAKEQIELLSSAGWADQL